MLTQSERIQAQKLYDEWQYWERICERNTYGYTGTCHSDTLHKREAWERFAPWLYRGFKPDDYPKHDEPDYDKVY